MALSVAVRGYVVAWIIHEYGEIWMEQGFSPAFTARLDWRLYRLLKNYSPRCHPERSALGISQNLALYVTYKIFNRLHIRSTGSIRRIMVLFRTIIAQTPVNPLQVPAFNCHPSCMPKGSASITTQLRTLHKDTRSEAEEGQGIMT
jgi:hypothetical protein